MSNSKKVVLLGHFGVGKTSLMRRFVENAFSEEYKVTLGVQIQKKEVNISERKKLSMIIWDIEGNTTIKNTRLSYLLGTSGFIYVFDATRIDTFNDINDEIDYLTKQYPKAKIKTIANKVDLINVQGLKDLLNNKQIQCDYFTSAKTGKMVNEMFEALAKEIIKE
ncbi:MAG: GTP-binding protein [Bacteroidia bacterium]|nr:GTP-binding protein [Bacteroidia bacterium]NND10743.1 GTP-binding protein [Flavobacteriaceae bacterium]MBT8309221.1 GTP-binding protein [Bacteroidia bacterium]NNK27744.1 GTP-binding protein [Flavobacteriaceae bacterium]NNL61356.1 GTP-binding protein [Flavobacteriaceae bacterium]